MELRDKLRRTAAFAAAALAGLLAPLALAGPASAAFPGQDSGVIAFSSLRAPHPADQEVYRLTVGGPPATRLTFNDGSDASPSFSPDGRMLLFNSTRTTHPMLSQVYSMSEAGADQVRLTFSDFQDGAGTFFPGGRRFVFSGVRPEHPANVELYAVNVDGTGLLRLPRPTGSTPRRPSRLTAAGSSS